MWSFAPFSFPDRLFALLRFRTWRRRSPWRDVSMSRKAFTGPRVSGSRRRGVAEYHCAAQADHACAIVAGVERRRWGGGDDLFVRWPATFLLNGRVSGSLAFVAEKVIRGGVQGAP